MFLVDRQDDFGQGKRAYTDLEKIVVRADAPLFGEFAANCLELGDKRVDPVINIRPLDGSKVIAWLRAGRLSRSPF